MNSQPATAAGPVPVAEPVVLVLSRQARPGHEQAFEEVLHILAGAVRGQPGHLDVTVLRPAPRGPPIYTIVSHFQTRADADGWLASPQRARPLISVVIVIPLMQYAVMPLLTRATRGILYPPHAPQLAGGAA